MKFIFVILIFVLTLKSDPSLSQLRQFTDEEIKVKVDAMADKYLKNKNNAGIVFGLIKDGNSEPLIYTYGFSNTGTKETVTSSSLFQIGSITKVFTSTLLAKFVHDGKMKLNDPVQKYLPSDVKMPSLNGKEITLAELAEHTSGLPRMPSNFQLALKEKNDPYANYTSDYLYKFLDGYEMKYEPGKHWQYSNLAFGLLGEAISLYAKKSYEELVVQDICNVLQMPNTRMTLDEEQNKIRVQGYSDKGIPVHEWTFTNCTAGAGALFSSIDDMMKWLEYNMGITQNELSPLLAITQKDYWSDPSQMKLSMGLGWQLDKLKGTEIIRYNKNGGAGGCTSIIAFTKEPKTGVVILSNSGNGVTNLGFELINYLNGIN